MHRHSLLTGLSSLDYLELRLSPSALAVAAVSSVVSTQSTDDDDDDDGSAAAQGDPLPNPEPPPPPDPGNNPPIVFPTLPSSGPPGPGS